MNEQLHIEVKQISYETLKPSDPTPCDRKSLTLSFIDQNFPHVHTPLLLIYTRDDNNTQPFDVIKSLKTSLPHVLTQFYPLAGRCSDQNNVSCSDQGVPFIETSVDCSLTHVLNDPGNKLDLMSKLLPPKDLFCFGQLPIYEVDPLIFQVNQFKCGGIVIGCYMFHKFLDASSISTFFNYWAALTSGRNMDLVRPNFEAASTTFPPPLTPEVGEVGGGGDAGAGIAMMWRRLNAIKVVGKSFTFDNVAIDRLKAEAKCEEVPNPTSFEVVAGFVWKNVMRDGGPSVLSFNANIRTRISPPLPRETMGNLLVGAHVHVDQCGELPNFVKKIHHEVLKFDQKIQNLKGPNGLEYFLKYRDGGPHGQGTTYNLASWCKLGLDQVNFGFGKPSKVIPYGMVNPLLRNTIMLVDYRDDKGDGIEVWLFLEESEMQNLESNSKFLVFASPS
ncbi:hypothetical protein vseg_016719 [Gypsophila vaccaria]